MKKIFFMLLAGLGCLASNSQEASEVAKNIALTPIVSHHLNLQSDVHNALLAKTMQIVTRNGMGSSSSKFVIVPNIILISKEALATAPVQYAVKAELIFFVGDPKSQVVISQFSMPVNGVSNSENKAYLQAINSLNPKNPQIKKFIDHSREKIIEYYNKEFTTILSTVEMLVAQNKHNQAIAILSDIPKEVESYSKAASLIKDITAKKGSSSEAQSSVASAPQASLQEDVNKWSATLFGK